MHVSANTTAFRTGHGDAWSERPEPVLRAAQRNGGQFRFFFCFQSSSGSTDVPRVSSAELRDNWPLPHLVQDGARTRQRIRFERSPIRMMYFLQGSTYMPPGQRLPHLVMFSTTTNTSRVTSCPESPLHIVYRSLYLRNSFEGILPSIPIVEKETKLTVCWSTPVSEW